MKAHQKSILKTGVISVFVLPYLWQLGGEGRYDLFAFVDFEQALKWYLFDLSHYLTISVLGCLLWVGAESDFLKHSGKVIFWYSLFRAGVYFLVRFEAWLEFTSLAVIFYLMMYYVDRELNLYRATVWLLKILWDKCISALRF